MSQRYLQYRESLRSRASFVVAMEQNKTQERNHPTGKEQVTSQSTTTKAATDAVDLSTKLTADRSFESDSGWETGENKSSDDEDQRGVVNQESFTYDIDDYSNLAGSMHMGNNESYSSVSLNEYEVEESDTTEITANYHNTQDRQNLPDMVGAGEAAQLGKLAQQKQTPQEYSIKARLDRLLSRRNKPLNTIPERDEIRSTTDATIDLPEQSQKFYNKEQEEGAGESSNTPSTPSSKFYCRDTQTQIGLVLLIAGVAIILLGVFATHPTASSRSTLPAPIPVPVTIPTPSPAFNRNQFPTINPTNQLPLPTPTLATGQTPVTATVPTTMPTKRTRFPTVAPTLVSVQSPVPTRVPTLTSTIAPTESPLQTPVASSIPTVRAPTLLPTIVPTFSQTQSLLALIAPASFDNGKSILVANTPQSRAFQWLAASDNLSSLSDERKIQRYAMVVLYYSTLGDSWLYRQGWLSQDNECTWYTSSPQQGCDSNGTLQQLVLSFNNLQGALPKELGMLGTLTNVNLVSNKLSGMLPSELGELSNLLEMSLRGNFLTGTLPDRWGSLASLQTLDLSNNFIAGSLPTTFGKLGAMETMYLGNNRLDGTLPTELGLLNLLTRLSLSDNRLSGIVPSEMGRVQNLRILELQNNTLSGISTEIGTLIRIQRFLVYQNKLVGSIATELGNMGNLQMLRLDQNNLSGSIPTELGNLSNLRILEFSENSLIGSIPTDLGRLNLLTSLLLNGNNLTGGVPETFANLTNLRTLRVDGNKLTGSVSKFVCDVFSLTRPVFYADCISEIVCDCCSTCCVDGGSCVAV